MLHSIDSEILFLQQEDLIKAGLLDMKETIKTVTKTYRLMGEGQIKNPPKVRTRCCIPDDPVNWPSFFNSMPCYIQGDVNIAGIKWAAESKKNAVTPGIPYGIDITILSDPETVLPFCILDGTLVTAMRTSAVGGLLAKYSAPSNTTAATLVGAGVIGKTMIMAVCESIPTLKTIYLCDLDLPKAQQVASELQPSYPQVEIVPSAQSKECALKSQLIITETTARHPFVDKSWLTSGCAVISMASNEIDTETAALADVTCIDYWDQMITYDAKAVTQLYKQGRITKDDVSELGDLVLGRKKGRTSDDQFVFATSMGIGALDIMVGYQLYQKASALGLGTKVRLWDKPLWE